MASQSSSRPGGPGMPAGGGPPGGGPARSPGGPMGSRAPPHGGVPQGMPPRMAPLPPQMMPQGPIYAVPPYPYAVVPAGGPAPFFSLDVECVATGPGHNDRAVAQVALVDQFERVLLNFYVRPQQPVFSYLTGLTGLTEENLAQGVDIGTAMYMVRSVLPPNAVLVGQNILKDVQWLGLQEKVDFSGMQDLNGLWRVFNEKYHTFTYFSLHHQSKTLLGIVQEPPHNAATDAILSVRLYNLYLRVEGSPAEMAKAHAALVGSPVESSFAKSNPTYDGVCMGNKKTCTCGSPFFY